VNEKDGRATWEKVAFWRSWRWTT